MYQSLRDKAKSLLSKMPDSAKFMAKRFEESLKLITPGILFEELGLSYIGPIDGHDLAELISIFQKARDLKKPVSIHAQTIKGYGYKIAQGRYEKWHSVAPFDTNTGTPLNPPKPTNPTKIFANELLKLAQNDNKIIGVTAAMPSGTGLDLLMDSVPNDSLMWQSPKHTPQLQWQRWQKRALSPLWWFIRHFCNAPLIALSTMLAL